eukprot:2246557-Amphidinium_carterae.1
MKLLSAVFYADEGGGALLCPGSAMGLQRKLMHLKEFIGVPSSPWTLACIHGGGCVHCALNSQDMDYLQWKCRWASQRSMRHYMQLGPGVASFAAVQTKRTTES